MDIKAYIYHKKAEKYSDCQDYFEIKSQNKNITYIAVSDGMSQSIYPQWWAEILVKAYTKSGKIPTDIELSTYQKEWQKKLETEIEIRESQGKNPWRLKNAIAEKSGAGATLCGITLEKKKWACGCIGDSCLIIVKKDFSIEICTSQKGAFGNNPDYLDSFTTGRGQFKTFDGTYEDTELMLVASDPFTELFQKHAGELEFIKQLANQLRELSTHESFVELVERWRTEYQMHNDDSTIVIIDKLGNQTFNIFHKDNLAELSNENVITTQQPIQGTNTPEDSVNESSSTKELIEPLTKVISDILKEKCPKHKKSIISKLNWFVKNYIRPIIKRLCKR
jgi:serine/threonine protein phosphatase PrpC